MRTLRRFQPAFECMTARIAPSAIGVIAHHAEVRLAGHRDTVDAKSLHGPTTHDHGKTQAATPCDSTGDPSTDPDGSDGTDDIILAPPPSTTTTSTVV
jgi:hypothetical protein